MKKIAILYFAIVCLLTACRKTSTSPVFEINKRVVYHVDCDFVVYATNETDFFSPTILYSPFGPNKFKKTVKLPAVTNYYVRDASCDCRFVLLLAEKLKENNFDIYLYNLATDSSYNITDGIHSTFTDPYFLNRDTMLFLKDGELHAYMVSDKNWRYYPSEERFSYLFKGDDNIAFLQDTHSSLWMFDFHQKKYRKIWDAPAVFSSSRKVKVHDGQLFFMSDHENGFNSIYKLALGLTKEERMLSGNYDYFLANNSLFIGDTLTYIKNDGLRFVSNVEQLPKDGVLYDFVSKNDSLLMLYANPEKPASLYLLSDTGMVNLLHQFDQPKDYKILTERKESGVDNLVLLPEGEVKQWVVWLHGGPHEQVSRRFNPYLYSLVSNHIGVIVLNYPGSTGAGNDFELHHTPKEKHLTIQLEAIKTDLGKISQKYHIDSFSLVGVSYGSILAHRLAVDKDFNVQKLIDFSGINTRNDILGSPMETLYIMGDRDFMLSNKKRIALLKDHEKIGARTIVLKNDGHNISRKQHIALAIDEIMAFLAT